MAQEWVFDDVAPEQSGEWVFADEEQPAKRKVSPMEAFKRDLLIGGAGLGEKMAAVIGSPLLLLPDDNKLKEDYARGVVAPFAETKERLRAQEGGAERDMLATVGGAFGTMGSMAPELVAGGAAQSGVKLVDKALGPMAEALTRASVGAQPFSASGAVDRYAEAKQRGMSTPEAVQAGSSKYLANTLMGMAPMGSVGPLFKRAVTGAVAGPVVGSGTAAIENVIGPEEFNIDPYDSTAAVVNAVTGGVLHSALGARGTAPKDLPKNQEVTPAAPIEYVQREIKDIQTRHESVTLDIANKQKIGENIVKSMSKVEQQIANLARLPDSDKKTALIAKLQEQLQDKQTKVESISKAIEELTPKQQMYAERLAKLSDVQKTEADDTLPTEDPAVVRARLEEEQVGRIESQLEPEQSVRPEIDKAEVLNREIESLQRFLATKQGNKQAREDAQAQLDSLVAERGSTEVADQKQGFSHLEETYIKTTDELGNTRPLKALLDDAVVQTRNPWVKSFLTRLKANPNLERLANIRDDYTLIKNHAEAAYENSTGSVLTRTEITPMALAHEVMHGAANNVLIRYQAGEQLPMQERLAAKYMNDSWNKFKGRPEFIQWKYAMSNVREFVAHLTDPRFINVLKSIDQKWYQALYDKFVVMTRGILNLSKSETQQFKDIMGTANYLIDTSLGLATPKSILEAVGIITKSDLMRSDPGSIRDIQSLSEPDDPLRLINQKIQRDIRGEETPISTGELVRAPVAGRHELAQSLKASPIVRHTNAVMKRADELFERGKRTILDGATAQKRKAFGILRNLTDTADERSYTTIYDKTNKGDLTDAAEVVLQAARDRVAIDSLDGFKRLSADKQQLVQALAQSYKRAHTFMNEQLTALGAKTIPFKEGYIAHGRNGDFALNVHAKAATGEQVLAYHTRFYTKQERDAFIARVKQEHPELVIDLSKDTWSVKHAKKHEQEVNEARTLEMLAEANKLGGKVDPELLDKLRTMSLEGRFFGGHHMFQTAAEGFSGSQWFKTKQENARDLFRGPFHYADEVGRFARNAYIHRLLDPIIDNPDLMDQHRYLQSDPEIKAAQELSSRVLDPNYDSLVKDAMDSMAGEIVSSVHKVTKTQKSMAGYPDKSVFDRVNGVLATVFNIKTMMARPAFAAAQGMSWMSQVPQYLSLQYGDSVGNQSKLMVAGIARAMDMRTGTEWDAMIERAKTHHTFKPIAINDFTAIRKEFDNAKLNKIADKGTKLLTGIRMSELADTMSRYITYAILYEKGKQLGLSGDKLFHFMADGTDGAMGLFQKDTKAPVITQTGIFGDLVAPVSNYLIMQGNWLGTAVKRLAKNGELTPLTTVILANIMAGGAIAAPLMLEYEILRLGINSFLDEDDHLPSAVRKLHNFIGDTSGWVTANVGSAAGRVADATLRQGAVTGAMQAGAEALGFDRAPDIGAGLRYQALGKNLFDENKSFADSFSAWSSIASDVALIKDIILGKDNTEAGMRKGLAALRTTVVHDFLTNHYFLPWMQANGKAMHTVGKDSAALFERNAIDDLAQALGGRSTRQVNEATAKQFRLEDDRKKQQAVSKAMQGLLDLTIRQESGQTPPIMEGRMPMAIARMQALSRKYPDMEPFLNTLGQRLNEEAVKKALPDIVRVINNAKPHEMKQKLEEYLKITGQKVTYE